MSGVEKYPIRVPPEWERALPGFTVWFQRFVRDVLSKADIRNAIGDGVTITGSPVTVATLSAGGFGPSQVFAPRHSPPPADQAQMIGELRAFVRDIPPPVEYADAQAILAQRVFGG